MVGNDVRPPRSAGRIVAEGMLREGTPVEYYPGYDLYVKREDLACLPPGPAFSKTRGVYAHVKSRPEKVIGVLDTYHSQAGHAVARACQILGKTCLNYFPSYAADPQGTFRAPQLASMALKAQLIPLKAGRSCILFHQAKKHCLSHGGYMMPNALKLEESVSETAAEVLRTEGGFRYRTVIIPASSGTIAAGVIRGVYAYADGKATRFILHLGYDRPVDEVRRYVQEASGYVVHDLHVVTEGYAYKDKAKPGMSPPWPCNEYYDLKTFRWWMSVERMPSPEPVLFWNIG